MLFCHTAGFRCPPQHTHTHACCVLIALPDPLAVSLKPVVWMCLSLEGCSHRDSLTEATFSHIDDSGSQRRVAFYTRSQLAAPEPTAATICMCCRHPRFPHACRHAQPHATPRTYLFIILTRTRMHTPKTPHRTCDCNKTILYSYEIVPSSPIFLI